MEILKKKLMIETSLSEYINKIIDDKLIKILLINFMNKDIVNHLETGLTKQGFIHRNKHYRIIMFYVLIYILRHKTLGDFNWTFLCKLQNIEAHTYIHIIKEELNIINLIGVANEMEENYNNKLLAAGRSDFSELINGIYAFLSKSEWRDSYPNLIEINSYSYLLIDKSRLYFDDLCCSEELKFLKMYIHNEFPLDSHYENFIQCNHYLKDSQKEQLINFNCRTGNEFLKGLLREFISIFSNYMSSYKFNMKLLTYYFLESIGDKEISNIKNFTYELLIQQYRYFKDLDNRLIKSGIINNHCCYTQYTIVQFYRFVLEYYKNNYGDSLFDSKLEMIISTKTFHKIQKGDYYPVFYNRNEQPPDVDKFCVLPNEYTMRNTNSNNNRILFVDLTEINGRFKNDFKDFLWNSDGNITDRIEKSIYIIEFLNFKENYDVLNENVIEFQKSITFFSEKFLYKYYESMELKYKNPATLKSVLKSVRKYLKFHRLKYSMTDCLFKILSLKGLDKFGGGKPISENDFRVLYNGFCNREKRLASERIFTIVFEIFTLTNLRIGEILNLTRDCLIYNNSDKNVSIKYLSKTSSKEFIYQNISVDVVKLVEEAISITESYKDNSIYSQYIFIDSYKRKIASKCKKIDFYTYFKKVLSEVIDKLEVKNYSPYNIRHTFINNVYKEGVNDNLTLAEMAAITGNSYKTSICYYRKYHDIELYVEALAKVTITDVDIYGNILDEKDSSKYKIVKNELGKCPEEECTFDLAECLRCNHFITFTNRIPAFEERIEYYNREIEKCTNPILIQEFNIQKKLLAKYLSEMYRIVNQKGRYHL